MGKIAFIFPGQGAQFVGMGKDFYDNFSISKEVFEEANESLGMDIKSICFEGPQEELVRTENTQPAILATSIAILRVLEKAGIDCEYTAGLSLGEYTSLVEAKAIKFSEALNLVKKRGKYMQEAVPEGVGGMAAILGLERDKVLEATKRAERHGVVEVANYNCPGQIVISGEIEGLKVAVEEAKKLGSRKSVFLPVSAPFHSKLLEPAGEKLKEELKKVEINDLEKRVVTNVDAKPLKSNKEIPSTLIRQVSNSVLWEDSINYMLDEGVETFIEIGPGKTLTGFVKRIARKRDKKVETYSVSNVKGLKKVLDSFNKGV